jgi:hypothetical protein
VAYRKLSEDEVAEIESEVSALVEWLNEHQLSEQDFLRQALLDGLCEFLFRVRNLRWLGWGYTLDSLRDVITAYMFLQRGELSPASAPDAEAMLQHVGATLKSVYAKVGTVKKAAETVNWLLGAYGAGTLVYNEARPFIAGLLGSA